MTNAEDLLFAVQRNGVPSSCKGDELQDKINEIVDNEFNRFLDAHQLTEEQLNDKEYIESLYNNYNENK